MARFWLEFVWARLRPWIEQVWKARLRRYLGKRALVRKYQPLLRNYEKDEKLVIRDVEEKPGTKAGENYMSIILRTTVIGTRGDGTPYRKSFIRKMMLEDSQFAKFSRNDELFRIECYVYETLLPRLGSFGPDCILAQQREIIMEDLSARGFTICERRKLLDLEHCTAVVETLASLHGTSLGLKLRNPKLFGELISPLCENIFPPDEDVSIGSYFEKSVEFALLSLESMSPCTAEVKRACDFLRDYHNRGVQGTMKNLLEPKRDDNSYWVITHGDTWNNNIMFLHNDEGRVSRVKFVDFQVTRHSSPAVDFTYFLYSSARSSVLERDVDELLRTYERFLLHDLRKMDAPECDLAALARPGWFKNELRRYGLYGLFGALLTLHAIFTDEGEAAELEMGNTEEDLKNNPEKNKPKLEPVKTQRIFFVVDHYIRHFAEL